MADGVVEVARAGHGTPWLTCPGRRELTDLQTTLERSPSPVVQAAALELLPVDASGRIHAVYASARGATPDAMQPNIGARFAADLALDEARTLAPRLEGEPRLVFLRTEADGALRLAWEVRVMGEAAEVLVDDLVYVSAVRGTVLAVHRIPP